MLTALFCIDIVTISVDILSICVCVLKADLYLACSVHTMTILILSLVFISLVYIDRVRENASLILCKVSDKLLDRKSVV